MSVRSPVDIPTRRIQSMIVAACLALLACDDRPAECETSDHCPVDLTCFDLRCVPPDPCDDGACTRCETGEEAGCNGCSGGVRVPGGWVCLPPGEATIGQRNPTECDPVDTCNETIDLERGHRVRFSRPVLMQSTEVTLAAWDALVGASIDVDGRPVAIGPSRPVFDACGADCPVHTLSFDDMLAFANAASRAEGLEVCYMLSGCEGTPGNRDFGCAARTFEGPHCLGYRLPTEAEWEYAARAGSETATYAGNLVIDEQGYAATLDPIAWHRGNSAIDYPPPGPLGPDNDPTDCGGEGPCGPHPVGRLRANAWGLHDMLGNVTEYVWDRYSPNYGGFADPTEAVEDPTGPRAGDRRVFRGGSYISQTGRVRSGFRVGRSPLGTISSFGFRLVRSLPLGERDCAAAACPVGSRCAEGRCADDVQPPPPAPTRCAEGDGDPPCNGCGAVELPDGFACAPAGAFTMGRSATETCPEALCGELPADEAPHEVQTTRAFAIAEAEVTQRQWFKVMDNLPSIAALCGGDCPVHTTTWLDAIAYANALSAREGLPPCYALVGCVGAAGQCNSGESLQCEAVEFAGLDCPGYRLPTEAEWAYAARAGTTTTTWAGPLTAEGGRATVDAIGWYAGNSAVEYPVPRNVRLCDGRPCGPHPVASKTPNPWGLHDTAGNAVEWVWDIYAADFGGLDGPHIDPLGPSRMALPLEGHPRTWRGGGWGDPIEAMRSASRVRPGGNEAGFNESGCWGATGIRPVRTLQ